MGRAESWIRTAIAFAAACVVVHSGLACAFFGAAASDQAAAIVVYPHLRVDTSAGMDTILRLSNASDTAVDVRCIYENATGFCAFGGDACLSDDDCPVSGEVCVPQWTEIDFQLHLTAQQPIGWRASTGFIASPSPTDPGPIPAVGTDPFVGSLRCIAIQPDGVPSERNVLEGTATLEAFWTTPAAHFDAAKYNAIGIRAIPGASNGDNRLNLGGYPGAEYDACPTMTSVDHFFDGAVEPVAKTSRVETALTLVPCSVDYVLAAPQSVAVHFMVYNEFEQRLGTSMRITGHWFGSLSSINPVVFDVGVQGTLAGHTVLVSVESGVLAVAFEKQRNVADSSRSPTAAFNVHHQGVRAAEDVIVLPLVGP